MSFEHNRAITLLPVTANEINQCRFVSIGANGEVDETTAAADAVGVSLEGSAIGSSVAIPVSLLDGAKVEVTAGTGGVTAGNRVASDATGRAIVAVGATTRVLGFALTTAAENQIVTIIGQKAAGEFVA